MRIFIGICLVAVVCADKLGYNYRPVDHSDYGLSFIPGALPGLGGTKGGNGGISIPLSLGDSGRISISPSLRSGGGAGISLPSSLDSGVGVSLPSLPGDGAGFSVPTLPGSGGLFSVPSLQGIGAGPSAPGGGPTSESFNGVSAGPELEYEKEFFFFVANDEDFNQPIDQSKLAEAVKKNLRVVFIKAPESNAFENAALNLAKQLAEQKTAVYVFNKQDDINDFANKLNALTSNINHKPDVHFVKYRTHEDAINAHKAIQNQYNAIGGPAQNFNGGVAPSLNFVSQSPTIPQGYQGSQGPHGSQGPLASQYPHASQGSIGILGPQTSLGSLGPSGSPTPNGSFGPLGPGVTAQQLSSLPPDAASTDPVSVFFNLSF